MKVELRLHGHLARYTGGRILHLDVPPHATVAQVLERAGLPERYGFAIFINSTQETLSALVHNGDAIDLVPVEQGGAHGP